MLARWAPKNAFFFEKFYRGHDLPHPRRSLYTPPVETPAPQRARNDCTTQALPKLGRESTRADRAPAHTPGRWARCTRLHSIPDRPRGADRTGGGRWRGGGTCPKLCRFGHSVVAQKNISFVNTFVAYATQNPFTVSQKCDIIMSQD